MKKLYTKGMPAEEIPGIIARAFDMTEEEEALWRATGEPEIHVVTAPDRNGPPNFENVVYLVRRRRGFPPWEAVPVSDVHDSPFMLSLFATTIAKEGGLRRALLQGRTIDDHCETQVMFALGVVDY